jgi:hypothetical protein
VEHRDPARCNPRIRPIWRHRICRRSLRPSATLRRNAAADRRRRWRARSVTARGFELGCRLVGQFGQGFDRGARTIMIRPAIMRATPNAVPTMPIAMMLAGTGGLEANRMSSPARESAAHADQEPEPPDGDSAGKARTRPFPHVRHDTSFSHADGRLPGSRKHTQLRQLT